MASKPPFLTPVSGEDVPELAQLVRDVEQYLGFAATDVMTMARLPAHTKAYLEFALTVMQEATLPPALLQMVTLIASAASGCRYCTAHAATVSKRAGVDEQKIAAVWEYATNPLFSDQERAVLGFAFKAAKSPSTLGPSDYDDIRRFLNDTEITEVLLAVAQMGFFNRWNDTVGTVLEEQPLMFAKRTLPQVHWQPGKHE